MQMRDKDFFKEMLGDYESPLSNRVSFDKVIAKTNRKAAPIWLNPKMVISAGLFLVIGTAFIGYYANGDSAATSNADIVGVETTKSKISNQSNTIDKSERGEVVENTNTIEYDATNLKPNLDKAASSGEIVSHSGSSTPMFAKARTEEGTNSSERSFADANKVVQEPKAEIVSTETYSNDKVEYTKHEVLIGKLNKDAAMTDGDADGEMDKVVTPTEQITSSTTVGSKENKNQDVISTGDKDAPLVVAKKDSPEDKDLVKGDGPEVRRGLNLEFSVLSTEAQVYGKINNDASIAGNQRSFGMQGLLLKEMSERLQVGAGIGYGLNESVGKYEWTNKRLQQVITSEQQIIVQPGLPDRTITVYDTSYNTVSEIRTSDLLYTSEYLSLPIGLRYKIKDYGAFKILASYNFEPGILLVNTGHVFNTSEVISTTNELSNSLVIQNRFGARLSYDLGTKWSFLFEPVYNHTYYSKKTLNANKASKFGMGVGLVFKL